MQACVHSHLLQVSGRFGVLSKNFKLVLLLRSLRRQVDSVHEKFWVYIHGDAGRIVLFRGEISPTDAFGISKSVREKAQGPRPGLKPLNPQRGVVRTNEYPELHDALMQVLYELLRWLGIPFAWIHTVELLRVLGGTPRQRFHKDQIQLRGSAGNLNLFLCMSAVAQSTLARPAGATAYYSFQVEFGDVWYCSACVPHAGPGLAGDRSVPVRMVLFVSIGEASSDEVVDYVEEIEDWKIATGNDVYEGDRTGLSLHGLNSSTFKRLAT